MRPTLIFVAAAAALGVTAAACVGQGTSATTVTSGQGGTVTGTGATGGSTPETDMLGTGRASPPPAVLPREVPRAPEPRPIEPLREEPVVIDAGIMGDAGIPIEPRMPP